MQRGFGSAPVNDSHFNMDGLLNVNHYANVDANPYVVGSAAYNYARGLPPPSPWEERGPGIMIDTSMPPRSQSAAGTATADAPSGSNDSQQPAASSGLLWGVLIVAVAFLAFK